MPPGAPSISGEATVCTESRISRDGFTASKWPSTVARSVSAARYRWSSMALIRSARSRAGLARDEDDRAGHQPPAEHPVQLGHAGGAGGGLSAVDLADGQGGAGDAPRRRRTDSGRAVLLDRAPCLALGAAAEPLRRLPAAFGAAVGRSVLRGLGTGSHAET